MNKKREQEQQAKDNRELNRRYLEEARNDRITQAEHEAGEVAVKHLTQMGIAGAHTRAKSHTVTRDDVIVVSVICEHPELKSSFRIRVVLSASLKNSKPNLHAHEVAVVEHSNVDRVHCVVKNVENLESFLK